MHLTYANIARKAVIPLLVAGIFGFYSASILTMRHAESTPMEHEAISQTEHCSKAETSQDCVTYHLSLLQAISQIGHNNAAVQFSFAFFAVLLVILFLGTADKTGQQYIKLRVRLRRLCEKTVQAFFVQLGYWLVLFEKRDPSYALATA